MPSWVPAVVVTLAVSTVSAYGFLLLRCRGRGRPFGPLARWWAVATIVFTAAVSTGLGVAAVAASHHVRAAYVGLVLPSSLLLGESISRRIRDRDRLMPERLVACLTLPLHRLSDRMGEDLQNWCDARLQPVWENAQQISGAAIYYYSQVENRVKDTQAREELDRSRQSIVRKCKIVLLIDRETDPDRLWAALRSHLDMQNMNKYSADDLVNLARRLEIEAGNELLLFLAHLYRLGYRKLLIYGFRTPGGSR
jgi:hypothetical protein